jgi:hypothetical protein
LTAPIVSLTCFKIAPAITTLSMTMGHYLTNICGKATATMTVT